MTDKQDLTHRCPFCGADPGTPCVSKRGGELDRIHMRRREVAKPKSPARVRQALCCQCGQLRTCKTWRKGGRGYEPGDQWRRRWVGQLKCSHCQAITDHALLIPAGYRDFDERRQLLALGDRPREDERFWDLKRLRREYREVVPQNPNLRHMWWVRDADAARAAGTRTVPTLCGGVEQLCGESPAASQRIKPDYLAPEPVRTDEYTDLETGESWRDGDCVDCLRVHNAKILDRRRQELKDLLLRAFVQANDAPAIERLLAALESCRPS